MKWLKKYKDPLSSQERLKVIEHAAKQVGPGVFFSNMVVIISFLPVFLLVGMESKLFSPLAWTKTFILLVDAFNAVMLTPVLISFFLRGKLKTESANPIVRGLERVYQPVLRACLKWRKTTIAINVLFLITGIVMFTRLGSEFMPPLDEGSILFMPVTMPDVSNSEVKRIIQVQDKI
ncbi:MAG: efflux RND transporter permease subunit, partial [Bacteroidetes bacterium]|nr:efflux RND transporter permease subunit [Bacteroidota bacterium]